MRHILQSNDATEIIGYREGQENNVTIELGILPEKTLFTVIAQTRTQQKIPVKNQDKDMWKGAYYNCQKPGHIGGDSKNLKQP